MDGEGILTAIRFLCFVLGSIILGVGLFGGLDRLAGWLHRRASRQRLK